MLCQVRSYSGWDVRLRSDEAAAATVQARAIVAIIASNDLKRWAIANRLTDALHNVTELAAAFLLRLTRVRKFDIEQSKVYMCLSIVLPLASPLPKKRLLDRHTTVRWELVPEPATRVN